MPLIDIQYHLFCPALPQLTGQLLHIHSLVFLIDNLQPKQGFQQILQGQEAFQSTLFIDHQHDVCLQAHEFVMSLRE